MDSWQLQLFSLFALFSIGLAAFLWIFQPVVNQRCQLMDRARAMIGQRFWLSDDLPSGSGHTQLDDGIWALRAEQQLAGGIQVEVVDTDGLILLVKPCRSKTGFSFSETE
ncbi:MAG: NfeD family protein [Marinobacterium sp.]|nr:NfeD family protein [Marinobacterium sp.]